MATPTPARPHKWGGCAEAPTELTRLQNALWRRGDPGPPPSSASAGWRGEVSFSRPREKVAP